jgi:hypothetical protein
MRRRLVTLAAVLLALLATATPLVAKKKPLNEEASWTIRVTPDTQAAAEGEKVINDTLVLQQGFLKSKVSTEEHAFGTGPYTLKGSEFTAQIKSNYEGKIDWSGLWTGDTIAGRMVWTRRDGTVLTYTFSGTRAPVEKAKKK